VRHTRTRSTGEPVNYSKTASQRRLLCTIFFSHGAILQYRQTRLSSNAMRVKRANEMRRDGHQTLTGTRKYARQMSFRLNVVVRTNKHARLTDIYRVGPKNCTPSFLKNCATVCANKTYFGRFEYDTCSTAQAHDTLAYY